MKTLLTAVATASVLMMSVAGPSLANVANPVPPTMTFPTDYDGFMADKRKSAAPKPQTAKQD